MKKFQQLILRRKYLLVLALLVLGAVHLRTPENFPGTAHYSFPVQAFLISFLGSAVIWEIQFFSFRHLYNKILYQQGFSPSLVWKVLGVNVAISVIFYLLYVPVITVFVLNQPLNVVALIQGLSLTLLFVLLINVFYLGYELYQTWQAGLLGPKPSAEEDPPLEAAPPVAVLLVHSGRQTQQLAVTEIAWFLSENKLVFAQLHTGKKVTTAFTLAELEEKLDPKMFFKINRHLIAQREAVRTVKKDQNYKLLVQLKAGDVLLPEQVISRYKAAEFKEWLSGGEATGQAG